MNQNLIEGLNGIVQKAKKTYQTELEGLFVLLASNPIMIETELFDIEVRLEVGQLNLSTIPSIQTKKIRIKLFGKHAFLATRNLKKGDAVIIVGELKVWFGVDDYGACHEYNDVILDQKGFFQKIPPKSQQQYQECIAFQSNLVPKVPALNGEIIVPPAKV